MKQYKRLISWLLVVALLMGMMPNMTLNAEADETTYTVSNFAELKTLVDLSKTGETFAGKTIELTQDIILTEENLKVINKDALSFGVYGATESSSVAFSGTFKGNGHTISGLKYDATLKFAAGTALFSYTKNATIQDLTIADSNLDADMVGGILIGYAANTRVINTTVTGSDLSVNCADNVLTLVTDGGMVGGGLIGKAIGSTLYNCEINSTYVHTNATAGVQALGGKGLYMGAMVGSASGTTIEYCRVINGSRVKNSYDIAVGALGGNKVYAGGIAGEISKGTKIIDSFSTAELYTYCATYVSVGAGNVGYVGGIAAASYGNSNEITRCHYAGKATSKQYNAAIVIPIIQKNKNISGIAERGDTDKLKAKVTASYFRPSQSPETSMKVIGDTKTSTEYGPQDDTTYADRSFWAEHDYDFAGTTTRSSSYNDSHTNKWVMDYDLGIPVHGQSVAAAFDFPGAGSVTIGATDLVNATITTNNAYEFAVQGFKPTTTTYAVNLNATLTDENYRLVEWYLIPNVTSYSAPEGHEYFSALMQKGSAASKDASYSNAECVDNDLFLAHMQAQVVFHDINGTEISTSNATISATDFDNWYDFEEALPDVKPTNEPSSKNARLIGWTTEKSNETGGGYSAITNDQLSNLRAKGSFYQTGDAVKKPMKLYPVYADLVSNIITIHEGNEQDNVNDKSLRQGVGKTWVTMDENNVATIYVGGENSTNENLTEFPDGYEFIGWYTDDGKGNQVCVSQDQEYTLKDVDLTTEHTYTARFKYRVQFWLPQMDQDDDHVAYSHKFAEVWTPYQEVIFQDTTDYSWKSSYTVGLEINYGQNNWRLKRWTDGTIRTDESGSIKEYTGKQYNEIVDNASSYANKGVTAPVDLSAITNFYDTNLKHMCFIKTDFPSSGTVTSENYNNTSTNFGKIKATTILNTGYNFVFYDLIGKCGEKLKHGKYAYKNSQSALRDDKLTFSSSNTILWDTDESLYGDGGYTYYFTSHITADVNFHTQNGTLIESTDMSKADYPYQASDKKVTLTRCYRSKLFKTESELETSYDTYNGGGNSTEAKQVSFTTAERGTAPSNTKVAVSGYYFAGWAEVSKMENYERAYAFDISNGTSEDGAPQFISSSVDKAKAYTLKSDAVVEHTMELYPVYVPLGKITTTTNLSASRSDSLSVPSDPTYTVTDSDADNGTQTATVMADVNTSLPSDNGKYELLRMTVSVDDGEETELKGNVTTGEYAYPSIEPGHSYLFTAYYQPYVVIFHQNGTSKQTVQIYNQYDSIRNTPLPTVQENDSALNNYLFVGWTEQISEDEATKPYITYDAANDETVTHNGLDSIYYFVDDGTPVTHAMELWPVYINIRVDVNSNIDKDLTDKNISLETVRKLDRNAADSLKTEAVATELEGYKFVGWYKGIPSDKLTDDTQYTNERLVSKDSSYHLTGDSPYETTVYTAYYLKVYKVIYHDQSGSVLETDYVYSNADHAFEETQGLTDDDGNPIKDESGNQKTVTVSTFPDALASLQEQLTDKQVFKTWQWMKSDSILEEYSSFKNKNIISGCISGTGGNEMHLYPVVYSMSAKDSTNASYDELLFSGQVDANNALSVNAYFTGDELYLQPSLTVHVDQTSWSGSSSSATAGSSNQSDVGVTLYSDDSNNSEKSKTIGTENTNTGGDAIFYLYAELTVEKKASADLANQSFLFKVANQDNTVTKTVSLTCVESEDGSSSKVTMLLPAGVYSVTEDADWAYRYDADYAVSYETTCEEGKEYSQNTKVAVSPVGNTGAKVICTNTEKSDLKGWLFSDTHNENLFDDTSN